MIYIAKYATYFSLRCNEQGEIDPKVYINKFIRNKLTEYEYDADEGKFKAKQLYLHYNKETQIMTMHIHFLTDIIQTIVANEKEYKIIERESNPFDHIDIEFNKNYIDKARQVPVITFLSDTKRTFRALKLQTGVGKTYCTIKALCNIKRRAMIILPNGLVTQWCSEIVKFTNLSIDDITVISGNESIVNIFEDNSIIEKTKIFIMSSTTLIQYINKDFEIYNTIPSFKEFIKLLKVGVKVLDECHLLFHINTMIDLQCNVDQNIYLSATYTRSNKSANRIFNSIYPDYCKFDDFHYDRYVNIVECIYSIGYIHPLACQTKRGYNQVKFEKWLLKKPERQRSLYSNLIDPLIDLKFLRIKEKDEKLLIFVTLKITGHRLCSYIQRKYPYLKTAVYFNESPLAVLEKAEVIISTIGSCGTGKDIKNLRTVINLVSFAAEGLNYQVLGRLRKLDNNVPEYVFCQNKEIPGHLHHLNIRRNLFKQICKTYETMRLGF